MCILASPLPSTRPSARNVTILNFRPNPSSHSSVGRSSRTTNVHTAQQDPDAAERIWGVTGYTFIATISARYGYRGMPLPNLCVAVREKPALPQLIKFPALYGTLGFTTGVQYSLPLAHILGKINPVHALQSYFFGSHFNIILPSTPLLQWCFCFMFPDQKPAGISILPQACHMRYLQGGPRYTAIVMLN